GDELLHAARSGDCALDEVARVAVQAARTPPVEQLAIARDHAARIVATVRRMIRELDEVLVRALELLRVAAGKLLGTLALEHVDGPLGRDLQEGDVVAPPPSQ